MKDKTETGPRVGFFMDARSHTNEAGQKYKQVQPPLWAIWIVVQEEQQFLLLYIILARQGANRFAEGRAAVDFSV